MLKPSQFIAAKYLDAEGWLEARRTGISATTVAKASTASGFREVVEDWANPTPIEPNEYMRFGTEQEPQIALWIKDTYGIMPNDWLIRHETNKIALATPDGLSLNGSAIAEIKTTGKDWGSVSKIPIAYKRQVQWQLYVTGASYCVFAWLLREDANGVFVPAWFEPKVGVIERDEKMIIDLVYTADELWAEIGKVE